jgi:hypothetical protein
VIAHHDHTVRRELCWMILCLVLRSDLPGFHPSRSLSAASTMNRQAALVMYSRSRHKKGRTFFRQIGKHQIYGIPEGSAENVAPVRMNLQVLAVVGQITDTLAFERASQGGDKVPL